MALGGMPVRFYIKVSLAVSVLCAYPVSAFAQSFLENLFGSTQQQAQQPQQRPKPKRTVRRANKAPIPEIPQRKSLEAVLTIIGSGRLATSTQAVEDIANVMGEISGGKLRITPVLGKSSAQNLRDLLDLTGRDMAVVDADVLEHLKQSDPALFARAAKEVTYVTPLFSNAFHIYTRAETKTIEALKGKKVSCDAVTAETLCQQLFSALKIDVQIVYDEAAVGRRKVLSGQVAAAVVGATPPLSSLTSLKPEDKLHFLAVPAEKLPAIPH
ncbi:MAG: TAXI family TRAP transporter solute-binding subunit [Alphaproteobacteria bacterium]